MQMQGTPLTCSWDRTDTADSLCLRGPARIDTAGESLHTLAPIDFYKATDATISKVNSTFTSELMMLQFLAGLFLTAWLIHRALKLWLPPTEGDSKLSDPPFLATTIPFIGHILGLTSKGSNAYISSLWSVYRQCLFPRLCEANHCSNQCITKGSNSNDEIARSGYAFIASSGWF